MGNIFICRKFSELSSRTKARSMTFIDSFVSGYEK